MDFVLKRLNTLSEVSVKVTVIVSALPESSDTKIDTRARARAISLKVDSTGRTQHWKLRTFRLDVQPDGRR